MKHKIYKEKRILAASELGTTAANFMPGGLTSIQAKEKLEMFGENSFTREKTKIYRTLLNQLINPFSFILIFASALSAYMGEYTDTIVIMSIVLLNVVLGFVQEFRSGKAVEKLSELIDRQALVIRDKEQLLIDVKELVPGDTIILRGGDVVPADVQIITSNNLSVNESQLTGESVPINKGHHTTDSRAQLLFAGSVIERGYCECIVCATGNDTGLGKIATLSKNTRKVTPYQKSLTEFSFFILRIIGVTLVLMLSIKVFTLQNISEFADLILFTIALAMTVIPEALPMITTLTLSNGALQLARHNVIVKRLSAVEDLGRVNILCTDKTGTLTQDHLTITEVISEDDDLFQKLAYAGIEDIKVKNKTHTNSFDRAFLDYVSDDIKAQVEDWTQLRSIPFDPAERRRRIIIENPNEKISYLVVVGSAETLLELSDLKDSKTYQRSIAQSCKQGMRRIAIAYKQIEFNPDFDILDNETDLTFLGFAKLLDPLRETAKSSIMLAKGSGVDVKILTGDSVEVAAYIGKEVGLIQSGDKVYTGDELDKMPIAHLNKALKRGSVFARVTPAQKCKIIEQLQGDNVVCYQGEGINDAPALKLADVSVAVSSATDVAKNSADIVLLDDNLDVIINGFRLGRSIFSNINKYIKHAMIGNIGNFLSLAFFYVAFAADIPMLAIQLLIANLIQDMPLMAVFSDNVDDEELHRPQVASQVKSLVKQSLFLGVFTAIFYLIYFMFVGTEANAWTQTNLFLFFNFTQLLIIISVRTNHCFWKGAKPSRLLIGAILFFMAGSVVLTYIPAIAAFMGFTTLPIADLAIITAVSILFIVLLDFTKIVMNRLRKKVV